MKLLFAALHESPVDAVDGSSTGTSVPWMWALLRLPRFRGASHAEDNDNRLSHLNAARLFWPQGLECDAPD